MTWLAKVSPFCTLVIHRIIMSLSGSQIFTGLATFLYRVILSLEEPIMAKKTKKQPVTAEEAVQTVDLQAPVDVAPESAMQSSAEEHVEPAQMSLFAYYQHRMEREANR